MELLIVNSMQDFILVSAYLPDARSVSYANLLHYSRCQAWRRCKILTQSLSRFLMKLITQDFTIIPYLTCALL